MEVPMSAVTVSSKFQIVIPREIRDLLKIKPGQKLEMIAIGDRVEMVRVPSMKEMRGILRGVVNDFQREEDDRH
jgi:AbrB family looped-hinge helix DNA binding protein